MNGRSVVPRCLSESHIDKIVQVFVIVFAGCTISYQIVFTARWPSSWVMPVSACLTTLLLGIRLRSWYRTPTRLTDPGEAFSIIAGLFALGLVLGVISTMLNRPDTDDISYFHRALVQLGNLDKPLIVTDTLYRSTCLPGMPSVQLISSYEMLVAFAAHLLGADPLWLYHNGPAAMTAFLIPIVYYLVFREFGLSSRKSLLAVVGTIIFLFLDGNLHRTYGNFAFVRLWQGKAIFLTLLLPYILRCCYRFFRRPSRENWALTLMTGICAVGLTSSGFFLVPIFVLASSTALFFSSLPTRSTPVFRLALKAFVLNLSSAYCVAILVALVLGLVPSGYDVRALNNVLREMTIGTWWQSLSMVWGKGWSLVWYAMCMFLLPWMALKRIDALIVCSVSLVLVLVFFNPLLGPVWFHAFHQIYWRLALLCPVPLGAGLILPIIADLIQGARRSPSTCFKGAVLVGSTAVFLLHFQMATISPGNRVSIKRPSEYRFNHKVLRFCRTIAPLLASRSVLAPPEVVFVLSLLDTSIRFEALHNPLDTRFIFRIAGDPREGSRRLLAQALVACNTHAEGAKNALRHSAMAGVSAIVVRSGCRSGVSEALKSSPGKWRLIYQDNLFSLFVKPRTTTDRETRLGRD